MTTEQTELVLAAIGSGFSITLVLLIARDFLDTYAAKAFILLLVSANVHMFHNYLPPEWHGLSWNIQIMAPAMFWIAARYTFVDPDEPRYISWALALYSFVVPFIYMAAGEPESLNTLMKQIPQVLEYIVVLMGIYEVVSNWNNDLVEARRRLRGGILLAMGVSTGWVILSFNKGIGGDAMRYLAIDISLLTMVWLLLQGRAELWVLRAAPLPVPESVSNDVTADNNAPVSIQPSEQAPVENPHLDKLHELMATGFYRQENMTLAILAEELDMPEYKLRATINKSLGYNNFNEYINQLRIGEAANRLVSEKDTPVTNIALDVGYRTMSSFNRAFRKIHDTTPSQYRESDGLTATAE